MYSNKSKFYERMSKRVATAISSIELFISGLLVMAVIINSFFFVVSMFRDITQLKELINYSSFQHYLSYLLLLIIALELAIMLIRHKPNNVVDVMTLAIARKMLIYNTEAYELLIGVVTIGLLFAIKTYILKESPLMASNPQPENEASQDKEKDLA
jgi:hypothetical protein